MRGHELSLLGCWFLELTRHVDERGWLCEAFAETELAKVTGRQLPVAQINVSTSHAGVIRGVHYSVAVPGQAKYVQCLEGSILDVIVDLRQGSPTFGRCESVLLSGEASSAVLVAEGMGHAFAVVDGPAQVMYALSSPHDPATELAINPFDPALGLPWHRTADSVLSPRDEQAPSLHEAMLAAALPAY